MVIQFLHGVFLLAFLIFRCGARCTLLRVDAVSDVRSLGFQRFAQQGVHVLRGFSGLDQVVSEVVHPRDGQPVLEVVQVQAAFFSFQSYRLLQLHHSRRRRTCRMCEREIAIKPAIWPWILEASVMP